MTIVSRVCGGECDSDFDRDQSNEGLPTGYGYDTFWNDMCLLRNEAELILSFTGTVAALDKMHIGLAPSFRCSLSLPAPERMKLSHMFVELFIFEASGADRALLFEGEC